MTTTEEEVVVEDILEGILTHYGDPAVTRQMTTGWQEQSCTTTSAA
jgi:hypothetical protein